MHQDSKTTAFGNIPLIGTLRDSSGQTGHPYRIFGSLAVILLLDAQGHFRDSTGQNWNVTTGDLIIIFPEIGHHYGPAKGEKWDEIYIVFEGPVFQIMRQAGLLRPSQPVIRSTPPEWQATLLDFATRDRAVAEGPRMQEVLEFAGILSLLLSFRSNDSNRWLEKVTGFIGRDFRRALSVEDMASEVGMSTESFRRRFVREAGLSPAAYRMERKMEAAISLVKQSQIPLKQIAEILGFADEFHFSRRFRARFGIPPGQCRQQSLVSSLPPPNQY